MKTLKTKRLILRPFTYDDVDDFFEYCQMETVGPNAGWIVHKNKEFSRKIISSFIEKEDVLAIFHLQDQKVIGSVGLHKKINKQGVVQYEIGYVLSTPYEGRGLTTEAVKRVIEHGFIDLDLKEIIVCHFLENDKSRRVIEKCNFTYLRNIRYETLNFGIKESKLYSLKKENYTKMEEN